MVEIISGILIGAVFATLVCLIYVTEYRTVEKYNQNHYRVTIPQNNKVENVVADYTKKEISKRYLGDSDKFEIEKVTIKEGEITVEFQTEE